MIYIDEDLFNLMWIPILPICFPRKLLKIGPQAAEGGGGATCQGQCGQGGQGRFSEDSCKKQWENHRKNVGKWVLKQENWRFHGMYS